MVALPGHWRWWQVLTDGVLRATGNFLRWNRKRKLRHNDNNNNINYSNNAAVAWKRVLTGGDLTLTGSLDGLGSVQRRSAEAFVVAVCHTHTKIKEEGNSQHSQQLQIYHNTPFRPPAPVGAEKTEKGARLRRRVTAPLARRSADGWKLMKQLKSRRVASLVPGRRITAPGLLERRSCHTGSHGGDGGVALFERSRRKAAATWTGVLRCARSDVSRRRRRPHPAGDLGGATRDASLDWMFRASILARGAAPRPATHTNTHTVGSS